MREIDANVRQSLTKGTEDLWKRMREVVKHMVDRLSEPESRFHATMVTNIFDLVSLLPQLNVNQDPDLERFAPQIRDRLCNYTARDLKKDDTLELMLLYRRSEDAWGYSMDPRLSRSQCFHVHRNVCVLARRRRFV